MPARTLVAALVLSFAGLSLAQDDKAKAEVEKKIASARKDAGKEYSDLGKWAADKKAHQLACPCWEKAIQYDPDNAMARQKLGYKKEGDQWVQDPKFDVQRGYEGPADKKGGIEEDFAARRTKAEKKLAEEFFQAGKFAKEKKLETESEAALREAIALDPEHAEARKALGYVKENGAWVSPKDKEAQKGAAQKVAGASEGEEWKDETDIEKSLGFKLNKRKSARFEVWAFYTGEDLKKTMRLADAAQTEFYALFDLKPEETVVPPPIQLIILDTQAQHATYVDKLTNWSDNEKSVMKRMGGTYSWQPPRGECYCAQNGPEYGMDFAIHDTTHELWAGYAGAEVASRFPWMFEGLAYYMSVKLHKTASTACIVQSTGVGGGGPSVGDPAGWKALIVRGLGNGEDADMRTTLNCDQNSLNSIRAVKAWSILDWLFAAKKKDFLKFISSVKSHTPQDQALVDAFGGSYDKFQSDWAAWVKANY